jgi:cation diffusion facilitator CzcD-associated flavoprotein CzcO
MSPQIPGDQIGSQNPQPKAEPMRVVIIGAGPSGLLLAHYLLEKGNGRFRVSIHEAREDPRWTMKRPPTPRR